MTQRQHAYILATFGLTLLMLGTVAVFSYTTDPYGVFHAEGWQGPRPAIAQHTRLSKAFRVADIQADTIILGSSRAAAGLNPETMGGRAYNLAVPGPNVGELLAYLQYAHASHPIKRLVLQPDFFSFNAHQPNRADFDLSLITDHAPRDWRTLRERYQLLVSVDHVLDGLDVLRQPDPRYINVNLIQSNGFHQPEHRARRVIQAGGAKRAFTKGIARYFDEIWFPEPDRTFAFSTASNDSFATFEAILAFARDHDIATTLYIAPLHAWHLQAIDAAGLWPQWVQWKRRLVQVNEQTAGFPLWDCSGYNAFTTEPVPEGSDAVMRWYLDSAHYNAALGDILLTDPVRVGVRLTSNNVEEQIRRMEQDHRRYAAENPDAVRRIQQLAVQHLPEHQPRPQTRIATGDTGSHPMVAHEN